LGKEYLWYQLPGWTPGYVISSIAQVLYQRGINFEQLGPYTIKIKKGGLILWEGDATITVYQQGAYIIVELSSSETRSFLTGGLIGRSKAKEAKKVMEEVLYSVLGRPTYIQKA